ncbi:MAG: NAD-dependent epimerase/dehydratase family protein [Calditrichaeota bacterium]|nr:NAD-dependent epimerase/dehydratase family protein [Calditrichota bacterium]
MRYFVTGATGFVGSWVAQQLVERGDEVICLARKTSNLRWLKDLPVQYHYGSLLDAKSLQDGIKSADYVLHIGGVTKALSIQEFYAGNVEATRNLMETVKTVNPDVKRVVYVGSQAAVGPSPQGTLLDETCEMAPITDYGTSKMQGEAVAREYMADLPVTILRPPAVYGPRDTDVFEVFKSVKNRVNLKVGSGDPHVSIIHVFDLARGIIEAALHEKSAGETYFICNETPCYWSEVIAILEKLMEKQVLNLAIPYPVANLFAGAMELAGRLSGKPTILNRQKIREVNAAHWIVSAEKIKRELGFTTQLSLEAGLAQTLEWYQEQGWL